MGKLVRLVTAGVGVAVLGALVLSRTAAADLVEHHGAIAHSDAPSAMRFINETKTRFDLVIINGVWNYNTVAAYRALAGTGIPYAVFTHGMLDPYFKRRFPLKHIKKALYWHAILQKILHNANTVLFTSEEEKLLARQSFSGYNVREAVVPYGTFGPDCDIESAASEFLTRWPHLRDKRLAHPSQESHGHYHRSIRGHTGQGLHVASGARRPGPDRLAERSRAACKQSRYCRSNHLGRHAERKA